MSFWETWLGRLLAGLSLFNLSYVWFEFGLSALLVEALKFYVSVVYPVVEVVFFPMTLALSFFGFRLPDQAFDFVVLYIILGGVTYRASFSQESKKNNGQSPRVSWQVVLSTLFLVCSISFWPVLIFIYYLVSGINLGTGGEQSRWVYVLIWLREMAYALLVAVILFAVNALSTEGRSILSPRQEQFVIE